MKRNSLIKILNGDIDLIDQVNVKDTKILPENKVNISPKHVRKLLIDFLKGKISSSDLTKWATFICLRFEYKCVPLDVSVSSEKYDEIADYYEDMMYVIQRLSTPQIDGDVNEAQVRKYLKELDKYKNDKYADMFK